MIAKKYSQIVSVGRIHPIVNHFVVTQRNFSLRAFIANDCTIADACHGNSLLKNRAPLLIAQYNRNFQKITIVITNSQPYSEIFMFQKIHKISQKILFRESWNKKSLIFREFMFCNETIANSSFNKNKNTHAL